MTIKALEFTSTTSFGLKQNDEDKKIINGFAVHGNETYNGFFYIEDSELQNISDTLLGSVLLKDHNSSSIDNVIGKITFTEVRIDPKTETQGVYYEAEIFEDEPNLVKKLSAGLIQSCSIGFGFDAYCKICGEPLEECEHFIGDEDFAIVCRNCNCKELSLVAIGADSNASVQSVNFSDAIMSEFSEIKKSIKSDKMESKITELKAAHADEINELKANHEDELAQLKEDYDAKVASKIEENLGLKKDLEGLKSDMEQLTLAKEELEAKLAAIEEEEIAGLRTTVTELNEKVGAGLDETEIAEFSKETLEKYEAMFTNILDNQPAAVKKVNKAEQKYTEPKKEDAELSNEEKIANLAAGLVAEA